MIMKLKLLRWQLAGFAVTVLGGVLLHFLYNWMQQSILIAPFSSVNESTWEHMKLLFFPMFIFALFQSQFFKEFKNFWCVKLVGILTGLVLIPMLFYTYNGAIGKSPDWYNIAIFFISAAVTFILETWLLKKNTLHCKSPWLAFACICLISVLFVVFTFLHQGYRCLKIHLQEHTELTADFWCSHLGVPCFLLTANQILDLQ